MAEDLASAPTLSSSSSSRRGGRHRHRGRANFALGDSHTQNPAPLSLQDTRTDDSRPAQETAPGQSRGRGRGGRSRGRGRGSHDLQASRPRTVHGRTFGGELTTQEDTISENGSAPLQGDAPIFVPGQPSSNTSREPRKGHGQHSRKRRMSKSTATDLPSRIHEDIDNGQYECMVCTNEVLRNSKVWSCSDCWSVFHSSCIKKWASSEGSAIQRRQEVDDSMPPPRRWRCPGCNLAKDAFPSNFTCWCEKEVDPKSLPGIPPFSCGQTCSRAHILPKDCPHPCSLICHAGPCPPCPQMGPSQPCFCGRDEVTRKCIDTDYQNGWSCGQICGEMMPCGEHFCERPCHEGLCGQCEVRLDARCYCGQDEKPILCCDKEEDRKSYMIHVSDDGTEAKENWVGSFQCHNLCGRLFDCKVHRCENPCHSQKELTSHCPRSPDVVSHCPCGKTLLKELEKEPRTSCEDDIEACTKPCLKTLDCGHACQKICHTGPCPSCMQNVAISCRCGRNSFKSICHQGKEEPPECMRVCRATLNCGRHECGEHCCTGEKKATDRTKRKPRALNDGPAPNEFEAEHICTRICGRLLKCGTHTCQELCHKGPCKSCREAVFHEVACNCGRTVLQPPLPCGTRPPPCHFPCERQRECGHPQVAHDCHQDEEDCPKCPFLTTKSCLCGKHELKNQPCWRQEVRCGNICGKKLKCGFHRCQKTCHKPGDCEDADRPCQQSCGKQKTCGHPCEYKCHVPNICKEDKPCQHKIFITCDCQRIKQEAKCNATKGTEGNVSKSLKCDEECARMERNRKFALALNIDSENRQDDHIPYQSETLNMYLENTAWAQVQERELRAFAIDPDLKRMRSKPLKNHERKFFHFLAEDFGFDSESMDPEPHRHVAIFKTPRFVMAPMKTLAECARIRQTQRQLTQQAANESLKAKPKASNVVGDPFNAFLITHTRFGLTIEEVREAIAPILSTPSNRNIHLDISFLISEEIILVPSQPPTNPSPAAFTVPRALEATLTALKPALTRAIAGPPFLGRLQLCRADASFNIERRESDDALSSGWNQVVKAGGSAPRRILPMPGQHVAGIQASRNNFAVFETAASKLRKQQKTKKAVREESVDEDWESAEVKFEAEEAEAEAELGVGHSRVGSAVASGDDDDVEGKGPLVGEHEDKKTLDEDRDGQVPHEGEAENAVVVGEKEEA